MSNCCNEFSRSSLLRQAVAEAEKGFRGSSGNACSGRDRSRPADVRPAVDGLALAVYGAGALKLPLFEEGVLEAAEAAAQPVLVSVFLDGGADSSRCLRRSAIPTTAGFDPSSRSPTPVSLSPRTRASAGIHPPPRCGRCISKAS